MAMKKMRFKQIDFLCLLSLFIEWTDVERQHINLIKTGLNFGLDLIRIRPTSCRVENLSGFFHFSNYDVQQRECCKHSWYTDICRSKHRLRLGYLSVIVSWIVQIWKMNSQIQEECFRFPSIHNTTNLFPILAPKCGRTNFLGLVGLTIQFSNLNYP